MYTKENKRRRKKLHDNELVKRSIEQFMSDHLRGNGPAKMVSRDDYVTLFTRVASILRPELPMQDLLKVIQDEFDSDCIDKKWDVSDDEGEDQREQAQNEEENEAQPPKNVDQLNEAQVYDALFELVDTWCPSIDHEEYVEFFQVLDHKLRYSGQHDSSAYDLMRS